MPATPRPTHTRSSGLNAPITALETSTSTDRDASTVPTMRAAREPPRIANATHR